MIESEQEEIVSAKDRADEMLINLKHALLASQGDKIATLTITILMGAHVGSWPPHLYAEFESLDFLPPEFQKVIAKIDLDNYGKEHWVSLN